MGSKNRIAKYLIPILEEALGDDFFYIEPFVGGANLIDKIKHPKKIGNDNNKYLIAMWDELKKGWIPPKFISREFYSECRNKYNNDSASFSEWHIIGYVGFNGSYGGRFYDGGYAGITVTKTGKERNYPLEAYNNVIKQLPNIKDIVFGCLDYKNLFIPPKSIVYCDIPYKDSKKYKSAKSFNHEEFYEWVRKVAKDGTIVFVSEYSMPADFECVWSKEVSSSLRANSVISEDKKSVEKLFKYAN